MTTPPRPHLARPRIAVDAMGGDEAPANTVAGVVEAVREYGARLDPILVGDRDEIQKELSRFGALGERIEVVHASERVAMDEAGADSFRKKKNSSLNVATQMVSAGEAMGVFSAGNTGAMVTSSLLNMGRIPGVIRPAIATLIPTEGTPPWVVILDVGATADCKPVNLLQFAILGEVYARVFLGTERPRVGLLNIGEESNKGSDLAQESHKLLAASSLHFVGNVEGRDILHGKADVVVTDGFTGNVLLKFAESFVSWGFRAVRSEIGDHLLAKMGGFLLKPSFRRFKHRVDYTEYGGAPLLGVNGVALIGHGRSNAKAIKNAVRMAADLINRGINEEIREELGRVSGGRVASS